MERQSYSMRKNDYVILFVIFFIGLFLWSFHLWNNIIFSYDQARDAQRIYDIFALRHLKLVGPETDIPGVFNGPLFYYLIAPVYFLSHFNPNFVAFFLVFLSLGGIFLLYEFSLLLFKNRKIGILAGLLWAFSFEQANFAKYISNASPIAVTVIVFFFGLALYLFKKKNIGLTMSVIALAAAIHFDIYLVYLLIFYPVLYFIYFPKIKLKTLISNGILFFLLLSPFLIAEVKWGFTAISGFSTYFSKQTGLVGIVESISLYAQKIAESAYFSFFSFNIFFAFALFAILCLVIYQKNKEKNTIIFLFVWMFSTLPLFAFRSGVINVPVINTSIAGAMILVFAKGMYDIITERKYRILGIFLLVLLIISNVKLFIGDNFLNVKVLSLRPMLLLYEKQVIDYTYSSSQNSNFSICSVSEPLFVNTLWSYLYKFYGQPKYGVLPFWSGPKQYLNTNHLAYDKNHVETRYIILENQGGIPEHAPRSTIYLEDQISQLVEVKKFGDIVVQKRTLTNDKKLLRDTQGLTPPEIRTINSITRIDDRFSCFHQF